jgi:hypothetical protein
MTIIGDDYIMETTGSTMHLDLEDEEMPKVALWRATSSEALLFETVEGATKFFEWLKEKVKAGKAVVEIAEFPGEKPGLEYEQDTLSVQIAEEEYEDDEEDEE